MGDVNYLGEKAKGVFIVITLHVRSSRKETGTLNEGMFELEAGGKTYSASSDATIAFDDNFLYEDIGPDTSATGKLAFDVAPKVLKKNPKLRIGELGFGATHGYIELPKTGG